MKQLLGGILIFFALAASGQIQNGSFEENGEPSLLGWIDQCGYGNSFMDASPMGGDWCLQLQVGNFQSCFPAYFYQILPDLGPDMLIELEANVRSNSDLPASLILGKIDPEGQITPLYSDTTSNTEWTHLAVSGIPDLQPGEVAAVILHAGNVGGPAGGNLFAYFDEVSIGVQTSIVSRPVFPEVRLPNPISDYLPIETADGNAAITGLILFSASGNELLRMSYHYPQPRLELYLGEFPVGPYFLLLYADDAYKGYWVLKI